MRREITVVFALLSLLWQSSAQATTDWDAKLNAEFQRAKPVAVAPLAALQAVDAPRLSRDMTIMLAMARAHWSELSAETQTLARAWMLRPTQAGDPFETPWLYGSALESTSDTEHFKIHFIDKDDLDYANNSNAATRSFVASVAGALETVWRKENGIAPDELGYAEVPSDLATANNGGNGKFDVYLSNLGPYRYYGYVATEESSNEAGRPYGATSYMVLDNDYQFSEYNYNDPQLPLKVTAAHEYFHAIQFGYSDQEDAAFMEQSATWMEDIVYPTIHDNYNYIGEPYIDTNNDGQFDKAVDGFSSLYDYNNNGVRDEGSVEYPEAALDAFDAPPLVQYGRFLWVRYLSEKFGDSIVKTIWENCAQVAGDSTFNAINAALRASGSSLAVAYQEYATWGYDKSKFTDGVNYPLVWVDRTQSGSSVSFISTDSPVLGSISGATPQLHLSTVYNQILNPSGRYSFSSSGGTAALTMLVDSGDGLLQHQVVSLSSGGDGSWTAPTGTVKVIAVISNVSTSTDGMSWKLAKSSRKKKFLGSMDGVLVVLLMGYGLHRRRSSQL